MTKERKLSMLQAALAYTEHGISVIPSHPQTKRPYWQRLPKVNHPTKGGKKKAVWKPFQTRIANPKIIRYWFGDNFPNVSLVCGQVSGGLVVFDFDYAAVATLSGWLKGIGSALRPLFPISRSGKGYHVYLRVTGSQMATKKVAFNEEGELLIDVKQRVGTATRLHRYVEVAVANECAHLARAFKGMRNDALNKAAFRLGRFVGAGLLTPGQVYQALRQACEANHYLQDDGLDAFRRTCRSGLVNGTKCGQTFLEKVLAQIQSQ